MPTPANNPDLFPVFLGKIGVSESGLKREAVLPSGTSSTVPLNLSIAYVNGSTEELKISGPETKLIGRNSSSYVSTLIVAASDVTISNIRIGNLTFEKGVDLKRLHLQNLILETTTRISPSAEQHVVDMNGARIENVTGGAVALFRPTGTITCSGEFTRCFYMQKNDPGREIGVINSENGANVIDITMFTRTFGEDYMIDYFAFNKAEELKEATDLANSLVWPTIVIILSVVLAHGTPQKVAHSQPATDA